MIVYLDIFWLFLAVVVHEFGHYIAFLGYNVHPTFKFTLYGINIGEPESPFIRPIDNIVVALAGIITGMVVIIFFDKKLDVFLIYIILCMWDIVLILNLIKWWNSQETTLECLKHELEQIEARKQ